VSDTPLHSGGQTGSARAPLRDPHGVFDADAVWGLLEGKLDRIKKVWELTKTALPSQVRGLLEAVEHADGRATARHAHALAGSAANFGAHEVVRLARAIERDARRGQISVEMSREISAAATRFLDAFGRWLDLITAAASRGASQHDT
jgi:HPt (histidine-containing phosphotransfer) domain-containing protein